MLKAWRTVLWLLLAGGGCGEPADRAELLDRLRGLGMQASPLFINRDDPAALAQRVVTQVYAAVPLGETVSVSPFTDTDQGSFYNLASTQIAIDTSSFSYEAKQEFQLLRFTASLTLPTQAELAQARELRYGFELRSASGKTYLRAALPLLTAAAAAEANDQPLSLELLSPQGGESLKLGETLTLQTKVSNPNAEESKYGWFVSGGRVANRRAASTLWTPEKAGTYTILSTARGLKSYGFAWQAVDITVVE